ncbi:NAD(P)-dependent oxidoreductase [Nocardioides carbamazepini]|uniref:NAD(P)-dependent oxidoreductase n=1 Tax=Nocardioides carbamazepini TaxID=2854259 RepID=UPI002149AAAF|nr:NAD(P)-dependent oxidoreductase [Nocardioides carbamazepini]MCR1783943.1 NAD(P)-dependent oxidoreductase [Nocardioides carbamazepini]
MRTLRVGFVGLGNIGKPMALRLAAADGIDLQVYDVAPGPVADLVAAGATAAASVAELDAEVVCVMVRDDDQVRSVAADVPLDRVLVVHSTVAPGTPAELAAAGHTVLDAPVSGGAMGAADGSLALMVGGDAEAFAAARPVLDVLGSKVVHAGPIGAGTKFKLARNLMHFVAFTAATEAQRLAEAAGLSIKDLGEVVRHTDAITGGPGAIMHRETTAELDPADFWHGVFSNVNSLGVKDLGFAIALAHELGVDVPLAELAIERLGPGLGLPVEDANGEGRNV